jgi:hypothetical protein
MNLREFREPSVGIFLERMPTYLAFSPTAISFLFEVKPLADYFFVSRSSPFYKEEEISLCERFAIS